MRLHYLGTAAAEACPALFCRCPQCELARRVKGKEIRTRSGAIIDGKIKLDFGPDSYLHALKYGYNWADVHTLLITHSHEDHFDLTEILCRREVCAHLPEGEAPMTVYGNEAVISALSGRAGGMIRLQTVQAFEAFDAEGYTVTPLQAVHMVPGKGKNEYSVLFLGEEVLRQENALFYMIEKDGKRILYAHDTDEFSDADMEFLKGKRLDLVSMDCTNGYLDLSYIGHMGANDNLRMKEKLISIGAADENTVFVANHFSHNGLKSFSEMEAILPGFAVAYDGMEITV